MINFYTKNSKPYGEWNTVAYWYIKEQLCILKMEKMYWIHLWTDDWKIW